MSFLQVRRPLPKPLERLAELAFDLRLIGSKTMSQIWRRLDAEAWSRCNNPYMILQNAHQEVLDEAAADEVLIRELQRWLRTTRSVHAEPGLVRHGARAVGTPRDRVFQHGIRACRSAADLLGRPGHSGGRSPEKRQRLERARGRHRPALSTRLLPPGAGRGRLAVGGVSVQRPGQPADHAGPRCRRPLAARATGTAGANALLAGLERPRGKGEPVSVGQQSPA